VISGSVRADSSKAAPSVHAIKSWKKLLLELDFWRISRPRSRKARSAVAVLA
jgi:hypothetical protein